MKRIFSLLLCGILFISALCVPVSAQPQEMPILQKEALLAHLYEADLTTLKSVLDAEILTSVELTRYYLERIKAYNEDFNCFITICDDALEVAAKRDAQRASGEAQGLLFGIPVVIKDNMDLSGYHTTNGFKKKPEQIASTDAYVVECLLKEGAVVIAKANMSTQAQDARRSSSQAIGETKSAYSLNMASGGSSGGSAVSTSLNFAAAALGTDTNSSLRVPAALAGCVSLRPTFGLISVDGIKRLNSTRDVPGAITRTVMDQAIMLDVLTQGQKKYTENLNADRIVEMRIGVLTQLSYPVPGSVDRLAGNIDNEVEEAFEKAIQELRDVGAEIVEVSMPNLFTLSNKTFSNNDQAHKDALYQAFEKFLSDNNIQAVVYPTYLSTPLYAVYDEKGEYHDPYGQIFLNNCRTLSPSAGLPEISVPIGLHTLGAGIGMEIASLKNSEQLLLDIAYAYTNKYNHRVVPAAAPNSYEKEFGLPEVIACMQVKNSLNHAIGYIMDVLKDKDSWYYLPQVPNYTEQGNPDHMPFVIIGFGLTASLATFLIVCSRAAQKKKRRQRRRKKPTIV